MKYFRKILNILLLGPLIPLIGIPDASNDNDDDVSKNDNVNDDSSKDSNHQNKNGGNNDKTFSSNDKTFSSDEVNKIISERLERERTKIDKEIRQEIEETKRKEGLSEVEKLKEESEEIERKSKIAIEQANKKLILAEVKLKAFQLNIVDADAAYSLMNKDNIKIKDDGSIEGIEESLKDLIEKKSYLIKNDYQTNVGDDQQGKDSKNKNMSMNALIRKQLGY